MERKPKANKTLQPEVPSPSFAHTFALDLKSSCCGGFRKGVLGRCPKSQNPGASHGPRWVTQGLASSLLMSDVHRPRRVHASSSVSACPGAVCPSSNNSSQLPDKQTSKACLRHVVHADPRSVPSIARSHARGSFTPCKIDAQGDGEKLETCCLLLRLERFGFISCSIAGTTKMLKARLFILLARKRRSTVLGSVLKDMHWFMLGLGGGPRFFLEGSGWPLVSNSKA